MVNTKRFTQRILLMILSFCIILTMQVFATTYKYTSTSPPTSATYATGVPLWNGKGEPETGQGILTSTGTINSSILGDMDAQETQARVRATMRSLQIALDAEDPSNHGIDKAEYYKILNRVSKKFEGNMSITMLLSENYQADMVAASRILSGFQNVINTAMGLIAWGLLLFSGLTTVLDMSYIFIPALQLSKASAGGGGGTYGGRGGSGGDRPSWITSEAYTAVQDSSNSMGQQGQSSSYKSAGWIYLKRRWWAVICLVFSLTLVLSSKFMTFIAVGAGGLLEGILETIGLM